jgi:formate-dependent nitrite reductase membrane component NrfD
MNAAFAFLLQAARGVPSDTYFTQPADWAWFIIPYFFIGGIAGGAFFIAAVLDLVGRPEDRPVVRWGYVVAAAGSVLSGLLLVLDLKRPLRFWHMLIRSEEFPAPILKLWSPISVGSWALLLFGAVAMAMALAVLAEDERIRWRWPALLRGGVLTPVLAIAGALLGLFFASYTGVLLSVTNGPIWGDSTLIGPLFVVSGVSTAAATLVLLGTTGEERAPQAVTHRLTDYDSWLLIAELVVLAVFLVSLGPVAQRWLSVWGAVLLLGVVGLGILVPLALHYRPGWFRGRLGARPVMTAAVLVLVGGFLLRVVVLLASETVDRFPFAGSM